MTSLGALLAASSADAAVNMGSGSFVLERYDEVEETQISVNDDADWDVDGDGSTEVSLFAFLAGAQRQRVNTFDASLGFGWAVDPASSSRLMEFSPGQVVDSGYAFAQGLSRRFSYFSSSSYIDVANLLDRQNGTTIVGFRFNSTDGETHYGFGSLSDLLGGTRVSMRVRDVYWEDEANLGIEVFVAPIPEPAEFGAGLGLLALGVAGLRRWRSGKNPSASGSSN